MSFLLNPTVLQLLAKFGFALLKLGAKSTKNTLDDKFIGAIDEALNG